MMSPVCNGCNIDLDGGTERHNMANGHWGVPTREKAAAAFRQPRFGGFDEPPSARSPECINGYARWKQNERRPPSKHTPRMATDPPYKTAAEVFRSPYASPIATSTSCVGCICDASSHRDPGPPSLLLLLLLKVVSPLETCHLCPSFRRGGKLRRPGDHYTPPS